MYCFWIQDLWDTNKLKQGNDKHKIPGLLVRGEGRAQDEGWTQREWLS